MARKRKLRFPLGEVVITLNATDLLDRTGVNGNDLLDRHQSGDWGAVEQVQIFKNKQALRKGDRILSVYELGDHRDVLWILTESNRSVTTMLLSNELVEMSRSHLVQSFHSALRIGVTASVLQGDTLVAVHCRQGMWDSACGGHCVAMALALLGDLKNVASLSERKAGVARRLWNAMQKTFFEGIDVSGLTALVDSLKTGRIVEPYQGKHCECMAYALTCLAKGQLVVVSWSSRGGRHHHWVLLVGVEDMRVGSVSTPHALLALDPGVDEPLFSSYNARLEFSSCSSLHPNSYIRYLTMDGTDLKIKLTSALMIGEKR